MEIKKNTSIATTLLANQIHFLSSTAQDDKDGKGLKLENIGHLFQVRMRHIAKIPRILIWITSPGKILFLVQRKCGCFLITSQVLFFNQL